MYSTRTQTKTEESSSFFSEQVQQIFSEQLHPNKISNQASNFTFRHKVVFHRSEICLSPRFGATVGVKTVKPSHMDKGKKPSPVSDPSSYLARTSYL